MEMEELKNQWNQMSEKLAGATESGDAEILKMTRRKFNTRLNKIKYPELAGTVICLVAVLYIILHFEELDTWYLRACAFAAILLLCALTAMSIYATLSLQSMDMAGNNYKHVIAVYARGKIQFVKFQKVSFILIALLFVVVLPLMGKLIGQKDFFKGAEVWYMYVIGFPFLFYFTRWVFRRYNRALAEAGSLLADLDIP